MRYGVYKWVYAKMDVRENGRMRKWMYAKMGVCENGRMRYAPTITPITPITLNNQ